MKWSAVALALAAGAAAKAPDSPAPAGCQVTRDGQFEVTIYSLGAQKRDVLEKRDCSNAGNLVLSLKDSVLTDAKGRIGSIVANYQFQFDGPPAQAGAIYDSGFSVCGNGSLALGGSTTFYRCLSGQFYNLYDRHWAAQCSPIEIVAMPCGGGSSGGPAPGGNGGNGGNGAKPIGTSMMQTTIVTAIADGQPQIHTTVVPVPMCQIGDGQVQVRTTPCAAVTQIGDGQPQAPTAAPAPPVSQISDGQIQAPPTAPPPAPPVSQIGDGQPQAPTASAAPAVSQISDGQPQAPTGSAAPAVSQISDGQPQAPTGSAAPVVSQISDGQPQAPTGSAAPVVSQISDGQPQAPTGSAPVVPTAAADKVFPGVVAAVVAVFGAVLAL